MLAGLLCVGNNAKERRRRYSQYGNHFTLPRCSILNLQLVELTNVDSKDTEGGCGSTSDVNWERGAALNFSPDLHATTRPSGLRNPRLSNPNEDSEQVLCGSDLLWYQLACRHSRIVMKNFADSGRMYKTPKWSCDLSAKSVCLQIL